MICKVTIEPLKVEDIHQDLLQFLVEAIGKRFLVKVFEKTDGMLEKRPKSIH